MMKLDGTVAFVATVDDTSISGASRRLGLAKSWVSERPSELEKTLGVTLVPRSTRHLSAARRSRRRTADSGDKPSASIGALSGRANTRQVVAIRSQHRFFGFGVSKAHDQTAGTSLARQFA